MIILEISALIDSRWEWKQSSLKPELLALREYFGHVCYDHLQM